jgi:hypothetical protein
VNAIRKVAGLADRMCKGAMRFSLSLRVARQISSLRRFQSCCVLALKGHGFSRAVTGIMLHAPLGAEGGLPSAAEAGFIAGQFGMPEGMPLQNEATPTQKAI